ncbi:MAG: phosphoglycerate dehydrogenase [Planctomycetota bacterium]
MKPWSILVADRLAPEGIELLARLGEVTERRGMSPGELAEALPGKHALIVRSATRVSAESLESADQLLVIGRAGIGVDSIDVEAATRRGIVVMNTPESGAVTTGEHAIAMLLSLARNIPAADRLLHEGRWEKKRLSGVEITGKTLGIIGLGRIGRVVAERALGLKMRVLAFDPLLPEERVPQGVVMVSFARCLAESDFLTIHCPLNDDTHYLFNAEAFEQTRPGVRLVHCARGGIVEESALIEALERGQVAGAALDVFEHEPLSGDHPLLGHPGVLLTPHLGGSTEEAGKAVARDIAWQVATCLESGIVINGINLPRIAPAEAERLAPFLRLAMGLASFLVQAFEGRLEKIKVITQGETSRTGRKPVQLAALVGALRSGSGLPATPVNAGAFAKQARIAVDTAHKVIEKEYVDLVRVETVIAGQRHHASGTLIGKRGLRIVELNGTTLDAKPEGDMLLTLHRDKPGVIGRIGTLLGNKKVNISRMQVGLLRGSRGGNGADAMCLLSLDSTPDREVLDEIRSLPVIEKAVLIRLAADTEREAAPILSPESD